MDLILSGSRGGRESVVVCGCRSRVGEFVEAGIGVGDIVLLMRTWRTVHPFLSSNVNLETSSSCQRGIKTSSTVVVLLKRDVIEAGMERSRGECFSRGRRGGASRMRGVVVHVGLIGLGLLLVAKLVGRWSIPSS